MQNLYYTCPSLTFHIECYHWVVHHYTDRDSKGNIRYKTRTEKRVTHRESQEFRFSSWRDISGCFLLDSEKFLRNENESKVYIKLELDLDFQFADDITKYDYEMQKECFKMKNIYRDVHMDFTENVDLKGFTQYNLVKIGGNKTPACMNCGLFLFFTFIFPVIELYKMYINSFCIDQDYTIKKVVSTRYNLNDNNNNNNQIYQNDVPKIVIYGQETNYNEASNEFNKVYDLPTEDELIESKKYTSSKIGSKFNKKNIVTFNKNDFQTTDGNNDANNNLNNNSIQMMQGGSNPMMQGGSNPMMQGGSNPMMQGGPNPIMLNYSNQGATLIQEGYNPMIGLNNNPIDLERKLLE